jgi:hypothetical protein
MTPQARPATLAALLTLAASPLAAALQLSPGSLTFPGTAPAGHSDVILTLQNGGGAGTTITVSAIDPSAPGSPFSVQSTSSQLPIVLGSGQSATATIRFAPPSSGNFNGGLDIDWSETTPGGSPTTVTYKQGTNGYTSGKSVNISTMSADGSNGFNGTTFDDAVEWCIGDLPAQNYNISPLMKYENLNIPAGSTVTAASLTCTFVSWSEQGQYVVGRYVKVPWTTSFGAGGAGVGWMRRDTGTPWSVAGARGQGTDVHTGKSFTMGPINANGKQVHASPLDLSVVQGWVDNPSSNHGLVFTVDLLDHHTGFHQMQYSEASERPQLSITYVPPGGSSSGTATMNATGAGTSSLTGFILYE